IVPLRTSISLEEKEVENFPVQFLPQEKDETRLDFRAYLNIMRRRKWFIIMPLVIVLPIVIIGLLLQKPMYEASVTLLIDAGSSKVVNIEDVLQPDRSREYYDTQFKLLTNPILAERVVDILQGQKEDLTSQKQSQSNSSNVTNTIVK